MQYICVGDAQKAPFKKFRARLLYADPPYTDRPKEFSTFILNWLSNAQTYLNYDSWITICCNFKTRRFYENIVLRYFSWEYVGEIIWHYEFGVYRKSFFIPSHDNILVFKKNQPKFYWQPIAIESQRLRAGDKRADVRGRVPGSVWSYPRVPGNATERTFVPSYDNRSCQPFALVERIVKAFTTKDEIVYDPFMGTGTVAQVCKLIQRDYYGLDNKDYAVFETRERLEKEGEVRECRYNRF